MIDLRFPTVDQYRDHKACLDMGITGELQMYGGVFRIPTKGIKRGILVIASSGDTPTALTGWDHVSASTPFRCPTWDEMCMLKDLFFLPGEWAMQLHPPIAENISNHRYCLHIWRPSIEALPLPPSIMVGDASLGTLQHRR